MSPEMEKRVDTMDISVLFFFLAVLIFWLCERKLARKKRCAVSTVLKAICKMHCAKNNMKSTVPKAIG